MDGYFGSGTDGSGGMTNNGTILQVADSRLFEKIGRLVVENDVLREMIAQEAEKTSDTPAVAAEQ